jgi:hypothetical protein
VTRAEAIAQLTPQGMSADDVDTLLDISMRKLRAAQYKKYNLRALNDYATLAARAYEDGVVSRDNAKQALVNAGYTDQAAELQMAKSDLDILKGQIDNATKAVRRAFLLGEVDQAGAVSALTLAGVLPPAAQRYVAGWQLQRTVPRISAATGKLLSWARRGLISVANLEVRLNNLGWNPPDIVLMLAEINQEIQQAQALAAKRHLADLAKAENAALRAQKAIQRAYCKPYSPAKLKLWYAERIIDEETLRARAGKCGMAPEALEDLVREAYVARDKADAKAQKSGPLGVQYTGQGADTGGTSG